MTLTAFSAVAVRRAILRATGLDTGIKWTNDLVAGGRPTTGRLSLPSIRVFTRQ